MMRTTVFRLRGQLAGSPSGVFDQSFARMSAPSSPPPDRKAVSRPAVAMESFIWNASSRASEASIRQAVRSLILPCRVNGFSTPEKRKPAVSNQLASVHGQRTLSRAQIRNLYRQRICRLDFHFGSTAAICTSELSRRKQTSPSRFGRRPLGLHKKDSGSRACRGKVVMSHLPPIETSPPEFLGYVTSHQYVSLDGPNPPQGAHEGRAVARRPRPGRPLRKCP